MNKILFPLKHRMQGPTVANLQDALQLFLRREAILHNDPGARHELMIGLSQERVEQMYGDSTGKIVHIFQEEWQMQSHGEVDEATAQAMNSLLLEWGAIGLPAERPPYFVVSGQLRREDGLPLQGFLLRAVQESEAGAIRLGEDSTDVDGRYTIRYELLPGLETANLRLLVTGEGGTILKRSEPIQQAKPLEMLNITIRADDSVQSQRRIEGQVVLEWGQPAEQLKLRLYSREFGGSSRLLQETTTLSGGRYAFPLEASEAAVSVEVRAVNEQNEEVVLSRPLNDLKLEGRKTLNLVAPTALKPAAAEYHRLADDLTPLVGEMSRLADVHENAERQDLTILNRATGWDTRLIALAALSEQLSVDPEVKLSHEGLYGLLRAGLPSDKMLLAQLEPDIAEQALKTVRDAGIVNLDDDQIQSFKKDFATFSNQQRLNIAAPGSKATYGALLKASGLPKTAQDKFIPVFLNHKGDSEQLWKEARNAGLNENQINKLKMQGKMAFLTGNSEAMTNHLMQQDFEDPAQLVEQDFHKPERWILELLGQANISPDRLDHLRPEEQARLETLIPAAYTAEHTKDRLRAYAEDMARKLRLSYPTQVVGKMIEQEELTIPSAKAATTTLLKKASAKGFRLGETPVAAFFSNHPELTTEGGATARQQAVEQLQTVQRLYQLTPGNDAMPVLQALNLQSSHDIMAYAEPEFIRLYLDKYAERYPGKTPPKNEPQLIYLKAKQVSSIIYNLFTIAKKLDSEPALAGMSPPVKVREKMQQELIKQFPTMESLFGSLDFCECEHCRSVLSPSAYLVDLLQFIDTEDGVWGNFLAKWKKEHGDQDYPHQDAEGKAMKPYEVLIERRPDLPYVQLSCENTHTALPYIDMVNEILEYYVAHGRLSEKAAHNTGEASTAELLAEPQRVIRQAYDKVQEANYPLQLPFDLWTETVRQFSQHFDAPLAQLLDVFRPGDALFDADKPYDRFQIFREQLGLSPAEAALFTNPDPLRDWFKLYGFDSAEEATTEATDANSGQRIDLHSAKALSRRLGVSYKEITEIIKTGFVNPQLTKLRLLYKLGVSIQDVRFYLDHKADPEPETPEEMQQQLEVQAFAQRLASLAEVYEIAPAELEHALQAIPFDKILVLADSGLSSSFDQTRLQYANGSKADAAVFLRINLLVRLWRKLGWTLEETERALTSFIPSSSPFDGDPANLARKPLQSALLYLAHLKSLEEKLKSGKQTRLKLLSFWSDLATSGKNPLYAQMFLKPGVLKTSPVFDHPLGQYLSDPTIKMKDHMLALQAALGLSAEEMGHILREAGLTIDSAALTLPHVSLLYRYGLLAKALKVSVPQLLLLKQLSGLDPFKPLHPDPLEQLEQDHPFTQTLRFLEMAEAVRNSGLGLEELDYLLRHRYDETSKYHPNQESSLALLKQLADEVATIRSEHAIPEDPAALTEEVLRQKLGLALPAEVVEHFMAMLNGSQEFTALQTGITAANQLNPELFEENFAPRQFRYNETRQEQQFSYRGPLFDAQKEQLESKYHPELNAGQQQLFSKLLEEIQRQARTFFEIHLQKQVSGLQPAYGFLEVADFELLFNPALALTAGESQQERQRRQKTRLAEAFLPFLQQRLIRQLVVQTLVAHTAAEPSLADGLLTDERLLSLSGTKSLLAHFEKIGEKGISAAFFDSEDLSGSAQATKKLLPDADLTLKARHDAEGNPLNPAGSARLEAYLEVPASGAYRFYVVLEKKDAEAELRFHHLPNPLFLQGTAAQNNSRLGEQAQEYLELKAGVPYRFSLELKKLGGGSARMLVQGETLPLRPISQLRLYPQNVMDGAENALLLLRKALMLLQHLGLNERETRYLLQHAADFEGLNLSVLPTQPIADASEEAKSLFGQFMRLCAYNELKKEMAGSTDGLIAVFETNSTGDLPKTYKLLASLSRRDEGTLTATAEALFTSPDFKNEKQLLRLWEALKLVERMGVSPSTLQHWTRIAGAGINQEQAFEIARDLKESLKARFEPEAWQRVAQPIFDKLRQRQRDALVAYVMHQLGFARLEQLYEFFLIDPGMEPVVQSSRIRLAIASVQLFIQRSLLNLERKVHPSTLNSRHWEWMKRYRVWEANRKIFLFPENWLEPEFRDDKTHLFTELEGSLLQGDVSADLAEDAFLAYLRKLEEMARLDIVAMHMEDHADPARRQLHVFGRTFNTPHKYFYRRYAHQMWTPWEPVNAEIAGDHLAPVVWRNRLYLFWVTFMEKAKPDTAAKSVDPSKAIPVPAVQKELEAQLHWSEYLMGEWSSSESGSFQLPEAQKLKSSWADPRSILVHVSKEPFEEGEERGVYIHVSSPFNKAFYLAGRNSSPIANSLLDKLANPFSAKSLSLNRYTGSAQFRVSYQEKITTEPGKTTPPANPIIMQPPGSFSLLPCNGKLTALGVTEGAFEEAEKPEEVKKALEKGLNELASLMMPVFYQDKQHTFFIEPSVTEKTVEEWQEWLTRTPQADPGWRDPNWWKDIVVIPEKPRKGPFFDPRGPALDFRIDNESLINPRPEQDWLLNPGTLLAFDQALIGAGGQPGLNLRSGSFREALAAGESVVNVQPGSHLGDGVLIVVTDTSTLEDSGLIQIPGGVNVVGKTGFRSAFDKNLIEITRRNIGEGMRIIGHRDFGR